MNKQQPKKYSEIKEKWFYRLYKIGFLFISIVALIIATINNNKYFYWDKWLGESIIWIIIISFAYFIIWRILLYVIYGKIDFRKVKEVQKQKKENKEIDENYNLIKTIGAWGIFLIPFIYKIDELHSSQSNAVISTALGFSLTPTLIYLLLLNFLKPKKSINAIVIFVLLFLAFLLGNNINLLD